MKILITNITAEVLDVRTPSKEDYIINKYDIEYMAIKAHTVLRGSITWHKELDIQDITDTIKGFICE